MITCNFLLFKFLHEPLQLLLSLPFQEHSLLLYFPDIHFTPKLELLFPHFHLLFPFLILSPRKFLLFLYYPFRIVINRRWKSILTLFLPFWGQFLALFEEFWLWVHLGEDGAEALAGGWIVWVEGAELLGNFEGRIWREAHSPTPQFPKLFLAQSPSRRRINPCPQFHAGLAQLEFELFFANYMSFQFFLQRCKPVLWIADFAPRVSVHFKVG